MGHHHIRRSQVCIITMVTFKSFRMAGEITGQPTSLAIPYNLLRQVYNPAFNMSLYWEGCTEKFVECSPKDSHGHLTIEQRLGQQDIISP